MAVRSVMISKLGDIRSTSIKDADLPNLYKRCGFRKREGFECRHTWTLRGKNYALYGKITGRPGSENKYDLPPPMDTVLFFGAVVIVSSDKSGKLEDVSTKEWGEVYETLFGGFESLSATEKADEDEEDEADQYSAAELTRTGYLKDGWIVDDGEGSGLEEEDYEES